MNGSTEFEGFFSTMYSYNPVGVWLVSLLLAHTLWPFTIFLIVYTIALYFMVYYYLYGRKDHLPDEFWNGPRRFGAKMLILYGKIWHGHEIEGLENIPKDKPALIIYYHGALPVDLYLVLAKIFMHMGKMIYSIGDAFLFLIPGFKPFLKGSNTLTGTQQECVDLLRKGHIISIAPGGVREAQFGDNTYKLHWGSRKGFARVAIESQGPIIPTFTVNIREATRSAHFGQSWLRNLYEYTRLPIIPFYGNFPVKLRTIIGKPIPYDPSLTPEELALKTAEAINELIVRNQKLPGNIIDALLERIVDNTKKMD